jgi:hypothetical protein
MSCDTLHAALTLAAPWSEVHSAGELDTNAIYRRPTFAALLLTILVLTEDMMKGAVQQP